MKLTKEDIKKYGTLGEKKLLERTLHFMSIEEIEQQQTEASKEFKVGDKVTFMNNRGNTVDAIIIKKGLIRARVIDIETEECYSPQYTQLAPLE